MQQCGQPPQEIVDELAPGMQFGPDGLPSFGGGAGDEALPPELREKAVRAAPRGKLLVGVTRKPASKPVDER